MQLVAIGYRSEMSLAASANDIPEGDVSPSWQNARFIWGEIMIYKISLHSIAEC